MGLFRKVVIFSMYKEMTLKTKKVLESLNADIDIVEVGLTNFIEKAKEQQVLGKDIIVCRTGIGNIIRAKLDIQVIDIGITGYDILKALTTCDSCDQSIAVFGTDKVCSGSHLVAEQLGISISKCFSTNHIDPTFETMSAIALKLVDMGIEKMIGMSIGDGTVEYFREYGIDYTLIESEEISIFLAVQNAINFIEMTVKERSEKERFKAVVNASSEGIVTVDCEGRIETMNPMAALLLKNQSMGNLFHAECLNIDISSLLKSREPIAGIIGQVDDIQVISDAVPIVVGDNIQGIVITVKEIKAIQKTEQSIRMKLAPKGLNAKYTFKNIKGSSRILKEVIELAELFSQQNSTVLITGETGTGKEVFAQAIHNKSKRRNQAFVAVNCSALPPNLMESELFGYSDGAFTGAKKGGKHGLFELAHNGTLFLDEVGELDKVSQSRLLRVIQEREIRRIGDDKVIPIDVRIVAATNKDLYQEVLDGNFRMDLYFRLDVLNLHIPPLRERKGDLKELALSLLETINLQLGTTVKGIDDETFRLLSNYNWPGNIRELRNVIEKITVITQDGISSYDKVYPVLRKLEKNNVQMAYDGTLIDIEKRIIKKVLEEENNNKSKTAERLGITRNTLKKKLSE